MRQGHVLVFGFALALAASPAAPARGDADAWRAEGREALERAKSLGRKDRAKNVIVFLGDGMNIPTVTAARILEGQRRGEPGEENELAFEVLPYVALTKTYNSNQQVPDSAGTMTAILSGVKTRAGVIGLDETVARGDFAAAAEEGHRLRSLFEEAEARGLATGVVTTSSVTHATPAACYAHSPERGWENDSKMSDGARAADFPDIARQLVEFAEGDGLEVALGGGRRHFMPNEATDPEYPERIGSRTDGRDLAAEWRARWPDAVYVWSLSSFQAVDPKTTSHLLGLFQPGHMQFEHDRATDVAGEPSLSGMTETALEILSRNEKGFVLMVEGARIDHAHHSGNAYRALGETIEFSNAVRVALEKTDPDETLVIVTADHGHVFTMAGYPTRGNDILGKVVTNDSKGEPESGPVRDALGLPYTTLGYHNGPGFFRSSLKSEEERQHTFETGVDKRVVGRGRPDLTNVDTADPDFLQEAAVALRVETHSGEDVPAYAGGPGAHLVHGVQEQSYLYYVMTEALGWNRPPGLVDRVRGRGGR